MPDLTEDAIRKLAGPKLDAAVARDVMGWAKFAQYDHNYAYWIDGRTTKYKDGHWSPSTNPADCERVLHELFDDTRLSWLNVRFAYAERRVTVEIGFADDKHPVVLARGETMTEPVCRAALLAMRELDRDETP